MADKGVSPIPINNYSVRAYSQQQQDKKVDNKSGLNLDGQTTFLGKTEVPSGRDSASSSGNDLRDSNSCDRQAKLEAIADVLQVLTPRSKQEGLPSHPLSWSEISSDDDTERVGKEDEEGLDCLSEDDAQVGDAVKALVLEVLNSGDTDDKNEITKCEVSEGAAHISSSEGDSDGGWTFVNGDFDCEAVSSSSSLGEQNDPQSVEEQERKLLAFSFFGKNSFYMV